MKIRTLEPVTRHNFLLLPLCIAGLLGLSQSSALAQPIAHDDAGAYTTWTNGLNSGFGFGPWVLQQTGTGGGNYSGFFVIAPGDPIASSSTNVWGIYANGSSGANAAVAYRGFTNALTTNTVFRLKWHNKGIGFGANSMGGFSLRHGNTTGSTVNFDDGVRFSFRYASGGGDTFLIEDGSGLGAVGLPFANNPFELDFILLSTNTYRLDVKDPSNGTLLMSISGSPLAGSGSIDSVSLYSFQTEGDQIFNNMEIAPVSLIPPVILNVQPANGTIYWPASSPIEFDATSAFSGLPTNGFSVKLNGVAQTNLTFTGFSTNRHVVVSNALANNLIYNATIVATDTNGNSATNTFSFNTWSFNDPFIEAAEYNFAQGHWTNIGNYYGLFGVNGIDYLEFDPTGATNETANPYRPFDLPQVEYNNDIYHGTGVFLDLAFNQTGEWENYTRSLSNTTYSVYARMAGFGANPALLLERLANPTAASSNQPRAALGTFTCPSDTGGVQSFAFVPLHDLLGNAVRIRFPGTNTFRCTSVGSGNSYNFNYLLLVPSTNIATILPYLSSASPGPGSQLAAADPPISFTIANAQTSVVPGTIQLFLNNSNVTSSLGLSNNTAGTAGTFQPVGMAPLNSTNTLRVVFGDGTTLQTNQWQFTVADLPSFSNVSASPGATNPVNGTVPVTFSATVNPGNSTTTVAFQFGLTATYGGSSPLLFVVANMNGSVASATVDGFSPGFTYHYRVVGTNQVGAFSGPDQVLGLGGGSGPNTAPQLSSFSDVQTGLSTATPSIPFTIGDAENAASSLAVSGQAANATLVPLSGFSFGGAGSNRNVTITPAVGQRGSTTVLVTVSDGTASTTKGFILSVGVVPGDGNNDGIVSQSELDGVLANYWPYSPWLVMTNFEKLQDGRFQFSLTNATGWDFSVLVSTNLSLPLSNWSVLGPAYPVYQFLDPQAATNSQRVYRLRYP